ncbi:HlyD family secretion protein [Persephonella sp.]
MKNKIGLVIVVTLILIFSVIAFRWIKHRMEYAITDAVFVETDKLANLSFKRVAGKIVKMYKKEGDPVKKGEILAEIDPTDYKLQLVKIEKEINSLEYKKEALEEKLRRITKQLNIKENISKLNVTQIEKGIEAAKLQIQQIDTQIEQIQRDRLRYENLVKKELSPKRKLEEIETNLKILQKKRERLHTKLEQMQIQKRIAIQKIKQAQAQKIQINELKKEILSLNKKIDALKQQRQDVQNLISYTKLKAPFDGKIAKKFKAEGEIISSGIPVYALVSYEDLYIYVLLEETKLKGIKKGSPVHIKIDAYPDERYEGFVEEINPVAAAKFALVPRDITAGEFTKVAQRIPVKVRITRGNIKILRIGMSGEVEIKKD